MKHKIEIENWRYEFVDYFDNPIIFLRDRNKTKYKTMDVLELVNKETQETHTRVVKQVIWRDDGMKKDYVHLTLGKKADFEGCLVTAVTQSVN